MTIDPAVVIAAIGTLTAALAGAARLLYADLKAQRDEWKTLAQENSRDLGRLTRAVEAALNVKVPPAS